MRLVCGVRGCNSGAFYFDTACRVVSVRVCRARQSEMLRRRPVAEVGGEHRRLQARYN